MTTGLLLSLLVGVASAHRPHTVVTVVVIDPDVATTGRAWLVMDPHDISGLLVSSDHGQHWDFLGGAPQDSDIVDGGFADGKLVLIGEDGALYTSEGGDGPWVAQALTVGSVEDLDLAGETALVATGAGLFLGQLDDASSFTDVLGGEGLSAAAFAVDEPSRIIAGNPSGELWWSEDGGDTFSALTALPGGRRVWSVASVGGGMWVGSDDGALSWGGAGWDLCADLPGTILGPYGVQAPNLVALADGRLLASSGEEAVFVSEDGCASWELLQTGQDVEYGGIGDATSPSQAFPALIQDGDRLWVGGFMGLSTSDDGGATWSNRKLISEDYCKGVAFSPDFPTDPTVLFGGYGGGVAWTADGGATWTGSAVGIESAYSNDLEPSSDFSRTGVLYYAGSNDPYRSADFGATWAPLSIPMQRARRFIDFGRRTYVLGEDNDGGVVGRVARTTDDGESWGLLAGYDEVSGGAAPRDLFQATLAGVDSMFVVVDQPAGLLMSADGGGTFEWIYLGEAEPAAGAAVWPPESGTRVVFASTSAGVVYSDDGGGVWTSASAPPEGSVRELASADDGTLFIITRVGQPWRSVDGGDTWTAVGEPIAPAVYVLRTAPNFAETPALIAGTQEGVYWSWDAGESWSVMPRYERLEAETHYLYCQAAVPVVDTGSGADEDDDGGDCATYEDPSHGLGGGVDLAVGDVLRFTFKGRSFRVVASGQGDLAVDVNGATAGDLTVADASVDFDTAATGWLDVTLTVTGVGADGLRVDLVEAFGEGEVLAAPVEPDSGSDDTADDSGHGDTDIGPPKDRCGCQGLTGGPLALLAGVALALRRRRPLTN